MFDNWVSEDCRWGMHGWACYETAIDCACPCHEEDAMSEEAWDRTAHRYWPLAILVAVGIVWWWHAKKPRA